MTLNEFLTEIANAIREKKGTTAQIKATDFAREIASISGGGGGGNSGYSVGLDINLEIVDGIGTCTDIVIVIPTENEGETVVEIGDNAFESNHRITSVVMPSIITVGWDAFSHCSSLTSVVFGANLESIGRNAFNSCTNLNRIDCSKCTSIPELEYTNALDYTHANLQIKVPSDLLNDWKSATNWSNFASKIVTEFTN